MERRFELNKYGKIYSISLEVNSYMDGNLAIQMYSWEDGYPEPWDFLTVNLEGKREKDCAFIDTNHNGQEILVWIIRNGLAVPAGDMGAADIAVIQNTDLKKLYFGRLIRKGMRTI